MARLFRIVGGIGKALFFVGPALAIGGCLWSRFSAPEQAPVEFPLGEVHDVATDSRGRIYVAEGFYARVQRYSPGGEFELGWSVPTGGVFALRTTPDDHVQVATARANKLLTYNADGQLVSATTHDGKMSQEFASETETTGDYAVRRGLCPHVVDMRTGQTVISTPWPKRLVAAPFPALGYTGLGLLLFGVSELLRRRRRAVPT
jgi:hypothetical protein